MTIYTEPSLLTQQTQDDTSGPVPLWFHGVLAVIIFSLTAPFTVLALEAFTPGFIAAMRAVIAGMGSIVMVWWFKWPVPKPKDIAWLILGGSAMVFVFPYSMAVTLQHWQAGETGIFLAGIPFFTALIAAWLFKEKTNKQFWLSLTFGTQLLLLFAYSQSSGVIPLQSIVLLVSAGMGYAIGGHVAKRLGGFQTICWMMVLYFPLSLFSFGYTSLENAANFNSDHLVAILALLYLAIMSQWIGFHFWFGSMTKIGIGKTGQLQLLQPFFTLVFATLFLGDALTSVQVTFAILVTLSVIMLRQSV